MGRLRAGLVILALAGGVATADSPRTVIVFPADGDAPALAAARDTVTAGIADAARAAGVEVQLPTAKRAQVATAAGCKATTTSCLQRIAGRANVDAVVAITVAKADQGVRVDVDVVPREGPAPPRATWIVASADDAALRDEVTKRAPPLFGATAPAPVPEPTPTPAPAGEPAAPPTRDIEEDAPPIAAGSRDEGPSRWSRVRWTSWLIAGAGVGLIAGGTAFMFAARGKQGEIDDAPEPRTLADFRALEELESQAGTRALWGNVLVGTGIVAVGVGTFFIVRQLRTDPDRRVSIAPAMFGRGLGVTLTVVAEP